jgi:hypothetical protein
VVVFIPFIDEINVRVCFHVAKLARAFVLLTLLIKLTQKLFNILLHRIRQ